jgi:hypothetical protein
MKRLMLFSGLFLITGISSKVFAEKSGHYQQAPKDSIPKKIIGKVKITVKDLMDGSALDSVYISVGTKHGYTDNRGIVGFDSSAGGSMVATIRRLYSSIKKVKLICRSVGKRNAIFS